MAKQIKAIKCPQCGSTRATETKNDYYRCNSCKSEFFIDNDDIHIHHRHTYDTPSTPAANKKFLIPLIIFAVAVMSSLFWFHTKTSPSLKNERSYWDIEEQIAVSDKNGEAVVIVVGQIVSGNYPDKILNPAFGLFNAKTLQQITIQPIDIKEIKNVSYKRFEDGLIYIVINENRLFLLDEKSFNISEITPQQINIPEFEKGFAKIKIYYSYANTLLIMNNLGQEFYYFPKINKAIPYGTHRELKNKIITDYVASKERILFTFSQKSSGDNRISDKFPELFKVIVKSQSGYPYDELVFRWDYDPIKQRPTLRIFNKEDSLIVSYENFTKGRVYIEPKVLFSDEQEILIMFKHELAQNSPYFFQILDAKTGEVKLTLESDSDLKYLRPDNVSKINEGYLVLRKRTNALIINIKENKIDSYDLYKKLTLR